MIISGLSVRIDQPMPRVQDHILDCVVYLYRSKHEAMEGINIGGTGFLIGVPTEILPPPAAFIYAVTNRHVVEEGYPCVRLNTLKGEKDAFEFGRDAWDVSKTDDLAILPMPDIADTFRVHAIPVKSLITEQFVTDHDVGVGDEVMMIGRFINREGIQKNRPTARFGHIAQMPGDPIAIDINGKTFEQKDAFLIETRSVGGFSGSPVYLIPNPLYDRKGARLPTGLASILGVDFCHIMNWVHPKDDRGHDNTYIRVPENTGMAAVVPAWRLTALLNSDAQRAKRQAAEQAEQSRRGQRNDQSTEPR